MNEWMNVATEQHAEKNKNCIVQNTKNLGSINCSRLNEPLNYIYKTAEFKTKLHCILRNVSNQ